MLTVAQVKKKLKGVGCTPPKNKSFLPQYKKAQEFLGSKLTTEAKITAAFFAFTADKYNDCGWSTGIVATIGDKLFYAGGFEQKGKYELVIFDKEALENIKVIGNANQDGIAAFRFSYKGKRYEFGDVNHTIPNTFIRLFFTEEMLTNAYLEAAERLRQETERGKDSLDLFR